jgi:hypothetical protein
MSNLLPNGGFTASEKVYVREWRKLGRTLEKVIGCRLTAFDPNVQLRDKELQGRVVTIPAWLALRIAGLSANATTSSVVRPELESALETAQNVVDNFHVSDARWPEISPAILLELVLEIQRLRAYAPKKIRRKKS